MFLLQATLALVLVFSMSAVGRLDWQESLCCDSLVKKMRTALMASPEFNKALKIHNDSSSLSVEGIYLFPKFWMCIVKTETKIYYSTVVDDNAGPLAVPHHPHIFRRNTLREIENVSEIYGKLFLIPGLGAANSELVKKLEPGVVIIGHWEIDIARKTFAVLIQHASTASFGFAAFMYAKSCKDGEMTNQEELIIVGYSQTCGNSDIAKFGLVEYLCHPQAFGQIPHLPSLYTGFEVHVKRALRGRIQYIKENIMGRRGNKEEPSKVSVEVLRTWSISNYTKCIGVFTYEIYRPDHSTDIYYFFVIYEGIWSGSKVTLSKPFTSILTNTEFSCMMALIDHLQPNYISEQIDYFDINSVGMKSDAEKLLYAADFAARKHTLKTRDYADKMPYINHPFVVAKVVMNRSTNLTWEVYAAIYLQGTLRGINTTIDEFNLFFGNNDKIMELVNKNVPVKYAAVKSVRDGNGADTAFLKTYENPPGALIEGNVNAVLPTLVKGRIKKYVPMEAFMETDICPCPFKLALEKSYWRGDTLHGLYKVNVRQMETGSHAHINCKTYYFNLEVSSPYAEGRAVVGEIYGDVKSITHLENIDIETAETWLKTIDSKYQRGNSAPNGESHVSKIVKCLEYASRKHFNVFERLKNENNTPYINHPIGVARLLIKVGGIFDIDLILAALLHDTLENTNATFEELEANFNPNVASLVLEVTEDLSSEEEGSKGESKKTAAQNEKAKNQSLFAVLLNLAERINILLDFWRQCQETKRRWQFLDAQTLLDSVNENRNINRKEEWDTHPELAKALNNLSGRLQKIITDFAMSLKSAWLF